MAGAAFLFPRSLAEGRGEGSAGLDFPWDYTENIIAIDETIHQQISGLYSSIRSYSRGMTVRKWLSTQSLQAQREFGWRILRDFGITP